MVLFYNLSYVHNVVIMCDEISAALVYFPGECMDFSDLNILHWGMISVFLHELPLVIPGQYYEFCRFNHKEPE